MFAESPDARTCEVRLGLVLYGGISLAIYINGVTQEFFRAVHGRGAYGLIGAMTDADVVVDVISGTSAGGINGIFLSYALCNGREFTDSASLWRRDGGIRQLLRDPRRCADHCVSVLDSEGYYQPALEAAFRYMGPITTPMKPQTQNSELDLFITGTDVDGKITTQFDDAGHQILVKDHRAVFHLKHRPGRNEPFNPRPLTVQPSQSAAHETATYEALAKLARLTSCFPAAFAPVCVRPTDADELSADAKLKAWGGLERDACFLDGGLLDNKPFSYTLRAIFSRCADRQVDRKLFYVEPDPECLQNLIEPTQPDLVRAVAKSILGVQSYETISDDLRWIAEHNSKVKQYERTVAHCRPVVLKGEQLQGAISRATRELYESSRRVSMSDRVIEALLQKRAGDLLDPDERRRAADLRRAFDKLSAQPFDDLDVDFRLRRLYHVIYFIYERLYGCDGATIDKETRRDYQGVWRLLNRHIKLLEIVHGAMEDLLENSNLSWRQKCAADIWAEVHRTLSALLKSGGERFRSLPLAYAGDGRCSWLDQATLGVFREELYKRADDLAKTIRSVGGLISEFEGDGDEPGERAEALILQRADELEQAILECHLGPNDPVRLTYERFETLDQHLFPLELAAGLVEKDIIETIRISPRDAERGFSRRSFLDKVAGDAFYHFGGFFKRSWRSNDILWGRLDGSCQLIETLLSYERLSRIVDNPILRAKVRDVLFEQLPAPGTTPAWQLRTEFAPAVLFQHAGERTQHDIEIWLRDLFIGDAPDAPDRALGRSRTSHSAESLYDPAVFADHVERLIAAAQLEAIRDDLPNVIADALEEQAEWGEVPVREHSPVPQDGEVPEKWMFKPVEPRIDPFVATVAAAERMRVGMQQLTRETNGAVRPADTPLGRFFSKSYEVGRETIVRHIPRSVLLEILAVTLLVVRNCLLTAFGERGLSIRRNLLYRVMVDLPLRLFHRLVSWRRASPRSWPWVNIVIGIAAMGFLIWRLSLVSISLGPGSIMRNLLLLGIAGVALVASLVIVALSRPGRSYAAPVTRRVCHTQEPSWLLGSFSADCRVPEGDKKRSLPRGQSKIVAVLREGIVSLRPTPEPDEKPTKLLGARIGLVLGEQGVGTQTRPSRTLLACSRRRRIGRIVEAGRPCALGPLRFTVRVPADSDLSQCWLVVLLDEKRGSRWLPWGTRRIMVTSATPICPAPPTAKDEPEPRPETASMTEAGNEGIADLMPA